MRAPCRVGPAGPDQRAATEGGPYEAPSWGRPPRVRPADRRAVGSGFLLALAFITFTSTAFGYEPPVARSYAKPTADGRHVLVMLVPKSIRNVPDDDLRKKYGKSGLYPADDPAHPVWTCDWYAQFEASVGVSNDGVYAVRVVERKRNWRQITDPKYRVPPRPPGVDEWPAVVVHKNGEPARTFALRELFDCDRFTPADCDGGPECSITAFLDAGGRVTVRTTAGGAEQKRTLDFRTGEVFPVGTGELAELREASDTEDRAKMRPRGERPLSAAGPERSVLRVMAIGVGVVAACTAAFLALAAVLVRGQRR